MQLRSSHMYGGLSKAHWLDNDDNQGKTLTACLHNETSFNGQWSQHNRTGIDSQCRSHSMGS